MQIYTKFAYFHRAIFFLILQQFATKLCNFTHFKMLPPAMVMASCQNFVCSWYHPLVDLTAPPDWMITKSSPVGSVQNLSSVFWLVDCKLDVVARYRGYCRFEPEVYFPFAFSITLIYAIKINFCMETSFGKTFWNPDLSCMTIYLTIQIFKFQYKIVDQK